MALHSAKDYVSFWRNLVLSKENGVIFMGKNSRTKKRRKKRLKKSVKLFILAFFVLVGIGAYVGYNYYINMHMADPHGAIGDADPEPDKTQSDYNLDSDNNDTEEAHYWVLNAGTGEAIYIQIGSSDVLIDTGTKNFADKIVKIVEKNIRGKLDYVVLTNPDSGRIGGVKKLYKSIDVSHTIIGNLGDKEESVRKTIGKNGDIVNGKSTTLELDHGATLSIFKPEVVSKDSRDQSLMTVFSYGDTAFVAESDAGAEEEAKLLGSIDSCDVLVLARHGSADKTNQIDLGERYTIVSTNKGSGLPSKKLIEKKSAIFSTAKSGTIKFTSDSTVIDMNLNSDDSL